MAGNDTEFVLSVYRQIITSYVTEYLDSDIPDESPNEDIAITTKRNIKKAIMPKPKDSATLAMLRMRVFEEYRSLLNPGLSVVVPDNWQAKLHQFPPQLVVELREVSGSQLGAGRWSFTIPHYRYTNPDYSPVIPRLDKGDYWARFILTDNSRVYVNAKTEAIGKQFITDIIPLIDPVYLPEQPYKIDTGKRGGSPIRKVLT